MRQEGGLRRYYRTHQDTGEEIGGMQPYAYGFNPKVRIRQKRAGAHSLTVVRAGDAA